MFTKTARFYDALYVWKDYAGEAEKLHSIVQERRPEARTLLDVACGTGKHLALLREHGYEVEGVELDPEMLKLARERLPNAALHEGDMLDFALGRTFDVVTCLFSSIAYAVTVENLHRAAASLARHASPGGLVVVEPFFTPDEWQPGRVWALFADEPELKLTRMDVPPEPADGMVRLAFHYLVGTPQGVEYITEQHEIGLFTHEEYLGAFRAAELDVDHDPEGLMGRGLYVGTKPAG